MKARPFTSPCPGSAARKPPSARKRLLLCLQRSPNSQLPIPRSQLTTLNSQPSPMPDLKRILLVEDSKKDIELTLAALEQHHLANEVIVARDGAEALDYLWRR